MVAPPSPPKAGGGLTEVAARGATGATEGVEEERGVPRVREPPGGEMDVRIEDRGGGQDI